MSISRRALLSIPPAAALLAVAPAGARAATPTDDHAALIGNTVAMFAGTAESNARPEVAAKLAADRVDGTGPAHRDGQRRAGRALRGRRRSARATPTSTRSFQYLYEIALATRAPGSAPWTGDAAVQRRVIDGLVLAARPLLRRPVDGLLRQLVQLGDRHLDRTSARPWCCSRTRSPAYRPDLAADLRRLDGRLPAQRHERRRRPRLALPHRRQPRRHHDEPDPPGRRPRRRRPRQQGDRRPADRLRDHRPVPPPARRHRRLLRRRLVHPARLGRLHRLLRQGPADPGRADRQDPRRHELRPGRRAGRRRAGLGGRRLRARSSSRAG